MNTKLLKIVNLPSSLAYLLSSVICLLLYSSHESRATSDELSMQNKPNSRNAKMNVTPLIQRTTNYEP